MFHQTFVNPHVPARRPWTLAVSLTLQCGVLGLLILLPMLHPEMPRMKALEIPLFLPLRAAPPPVPAPPSATRARIAPTRVFVGPPVLTQPGRIPPHASSLPDPPEAAIPGALPPTPGGGAALTGLPRVLPLPEVLPAPPPHVTRPEPPRGALHVSAGVQAARLIFSPRPLYPPLAKAARVQGVVRMQAVIAADGAIRNLRVVSGPPLLVDAAVQAVSRWRYQPTLLSGKAVEVVTEIDVNFTLNP